MITSPWAETVWTSGQEGIISFDVKQTRSDINLDRVSLELMSGNPLDGLQVAIIASDVPITKNSVAWKVPDFPQNLDYFVRVGDGDHWYFSHTFTIQGSGHVRLPSKPTPTEDISDKAKDKEYFASASKSSSSSSSSNMSSSSAVAEKYSPSKAKIEANDTSGNTTNPKPKGASSHGLSTSVPALSIGLLGLFFSSV